MKNLKQSVIRGSFARLFSQGTVFLLRLVSLLALARLLEPKDFGLVAMALAVTGVYELLTWGGLSSASIQKDEICNKQLSTLFWINILVGLFIGLSSLIVGPLLATFYGDDRLSLVTIALAGGFVVASVGVQHSAILHRQLKYTVLAAIEVIAVACAIVVALAVALAGGGYWALVALTNTFYLVGTVAVCVYTRWVPDRPCWVPGTGSLLTFGGTVTLNAFLLYCASNIEKVLLGRYWGPEVLGLYGRASQLISFGSNNLHAAVGPIAFSALSRLNGDHARYKRFFLKLYGLINSVTIPATIFCAIYADDIIVLALGQKWDQRHPSSATLHRQC